MESTLIKGRPRQECGTRAARRCRATGWVPAVLYGHAQPPLHFEVLHEDAERVIASGHHVLSLEVGGERSDGLLKEIQLDALGEELLHLDFARISREEVVEVNVPIETFGTPKGLSAGGILDVLHHELPLAGRADQLPEKLEVDIGELLVGDSIRIGDLALPAGVAAKSGPEEPVVIVHPPRGKELLERAEEPTEGPEVVGEAAEEGQRASGEPSSREG